MFKYALVLLSMISPVYAQFDALPDSPLDSSMGEASGDTVGTLNQLSDSNDPRPPTDQERQEEEEISEEDYSGPSDREFNKNWDQEAQDIGF